jgi:class 3 adenylate cyclase/tetratricopeptide (TPR) repeat protein
MVAATVTCSRCAHENPPGSRFCLECGASLSRLCGECRAEVPPPAKFCNQCGAPIAAASASPREVGTGAGRRRAPAARRPEPEPRDYTPRHLAEKILNTRSSLEGERKQVTVLFADVRSSLELSSGVDPEEWHRTLDRFFHILSEGVHRFEGTVNQYTGDGIMALFGAPIAHEDHAHRACYAALHLREALRRYSDELRVQKSVDFSVRIGLNSGEVVVGKIGDNLRMDYTAQGETVGLAARMQQVAAPNAVVLSAGTARLVEGYFQLRELGQTQVKGVRDPMSVFELEKAGAIRTRLEASRARGFSKFVGRAPEVAALEDALARVEVGEGQVVGVVAQAGVGKSRLCVEFLEGARARGVQVREGHCLAHGRTVPLLPVLEILRGFFEIADDDSAVTIRNKIAGALLLLDRELEPSLPLVFDLLGAPDPTLPVPGPADDARERRMLDVLRRIIQARSEREPGVILIEDLHWMDAASSQFLDDVIDVVPGTRTLLLLNFRPEYRADWMQRTYYRQLPLRPLGPREIRELLDDLLGKEPELAELAEGIRARTAGNPFFIEEVVRSLVETGKLAGARGAYRLTGPVGTIEIPETVQPVLAARIDRLPEREKQVLQAASVLEDPLAEGALREMLDLPEAALGDALRQLVASEFLHEAALYPEIEYAFNHPLTQEVAYRAQLADRRARLHARAARALEARAGENRRERAALLAHHFDEAGEPREAARWHVLAAERMAVMHTPESYRHWERVRALADSLAGQPEAEELGTRARIELFSTGARIGRPESEMKGLFKDCETIVARTGSDTARAQLLTAYGFYRMYVTANALEAAETLGEAIDLADRTGDVELGLGPRFAMSSVYIARDLARCVGQADEAFALMREHPELRGRVMPTGFTAGTGFLFVRSVALIQMGELRRAEEGVAELKRLAAEEPDAAGVAHAGARMLALARGDLASAEREHAVARERTEGTGNLSAVVITNVGTADLLLERGRPDEALATLQETLELQRKRLIFRQIEPLVLRAMARARVLRGELDTALALAEEAWAFATERGLTTGAIAACLALAEVALARNGAASHAEVEGRLAGAEAGIAECSNALAQPPVHELRSALAGLEGDVARRRSELLKARRLWRAMGATGHVARVEAALERGGARS